MKPEIDSRGTKKWWVDRKLHRVDGPAIEFTNGTKKWLLNGKRHRTNGPAVEWEDGTKEWYINGEQHKTDGPAYESPNGNKEWWLNNIRYTEIEFYQELIRTTDDPNKINQYKKQLIKVSLK